jgi:hypothetical protein
MQKNGRPIVCQSVGHGQPATNSHPLARVRVSFFVQLPPLFTNSSPPFWAHVVNSISLALAHARPAQIYPKIFTHP